MARPPEHLRQSARWWRVSRVRRRRPEPLPPLTWRQQQILDGWIRMLDIDLELAQQTLRLPTRSLPLPPIALPAVVVDGVERAPAVEAPSPEEAAAPPAAPVVGLRGAYARRAAARRS